MLLLICGISFALTVGELANICKTPQGMSDWLFNNIEGVSDKDYYGKDYWQTPEETIKLRQGDCEDFAILTQALLKELNIKSKLLLLGFSNKKYGHMVCYWRKNRKYNFMDTWCLVETNYSSLEQALSKLCPTWNHYWIMTPNKRVIKQKRRQRSLIPEITIKGDEK